MIPNNAYDNPYDVPPEPQHPDDLTYTPNQDERNLALIAHLSGMIGVFTGGFIGFAGPLLIYLLKKDTSHYVEEQAKEALNFQITLFIVALVCVALMFISCFALFFLPFFPPIAQFVFAILASIAVKNGKPYRYPFNIRFIS
jgi:hypothetical protein